MDYSKLSNFKPKLQKIYNSKAVDEKEIIYACLIPKNPFFTEEELKKEKEELEKIQRESNIIRASIVINNKSNVLQGIRPSHLNALGVSNYIQKQKDVLLLITHNQKEYFIEIVTLIISLQIEIEFNYMVDFPNISVIEFDQFKNELMVYPKKMKLEFDQNLNDINGKNKNCYEFLWCIIHLLDKNKMKVNYNIKLKGINNKDIDDYGEMNKLKENINPKIFSHVNKKDKSLIDVTDDELDTLHSTLSDLGINSIINMDLEHINSKIEDFSIGKSEEFLKQLNGEFKTYVDGFLIQLSNLDGKINSLNINNNNDRAGVDEIYGGIQKIEEKNHRIKLRNINKKKLCDFMKNLLEQLTITPQRKEVLLHTQYISMSELVIVNEVLDNFVKFYKNRKFEDIDMDLVREGDAFIKNIITSLIKNFDSSIYNYIKKNSFTESNLLRGLPKFVNKEARTQISELRKKIPSSKERLSLRNYLLDRKFMAQHLNSLFEGQKSLNEIDAFKLCTECISKGMRDSFAKEFNTVVSVWEFFFESDLLDETQYNLYLDSETFTKFDAFQHLNDNPIFEANKFFSVLIINTFFNCEVYIDLLKNYFSFNPLFNLENNPQVLSKCENIISKKVYDSMSSNFESSSQKSILLAAILYAILSSVKEKISHSVNDFVQMKLKDIFELRNNDDESTNENNTSQMTDINTMYNNNYTMNDKANDIYNLENLGIYKISSEVTKEFLTNNLRTIKDSLFKFMEEQKDIVHKYKCEIRRIGIIPIVQKSINFFKLILSITNGIKTDAIFILFQNFLNELKSAIERISHSNKKYTNIVLTENYHYIYRFFLELEKCGLNIDNPKYSEYENEYQGLYETYKNNYIEEIYEYQFPDFHYYYNKFISLFQNNKSEIKLQNNYTPSNFMKNVHNFLKNYNKNLETMASRVVKHYCKEENLAPSIWKEAVIFLINKLKEISDSCKECYEQNIDVSSNIKFTKDFNFKELYKKK
jgi:hypothetical protein